MNKIKVNLLVVNTIYISVYFECSKCPVFCFPAFAVLNSDIGHSCVESVFPHAILTPYMQYTSMSALSIDIFGTNAHNLNASAIYDHVYERGK